MTSRKSAIASLLACCLGATNVWAADARQDDAGKRSPRSDVEVASNDGVTISLDDFQSFRGMLQSQEDQIRELRSELDAIRKRQAAAVARELPAPGGGAPRGVRQAGRNSSGPNLAAPAFIITGDGSADSQDVDVLVQRVLASLEAEQSGAPGPGPTYEAGYDKGFFIRSTDMDERPFSLSVTGRSQFRHIGFHRDVKTWTNNAGVTNPVRSRNDFDIERARLMFNAYFLDPKLHMYINLDGDTDDNHRVIFHDFWVDYEFSKAFRLYMGKRQVPGSRDWTNGSTRMRLVDRSMATTFFRPDRTVGFWADGEIRENVFYRVMLGNGFTTTDLNQASIDDQFGYAASMWTDVWGDYGQGYSDLEWHDCLAMLVGHSFSYSSNRGNDPTGDPLTEQNFARLSDGTRLTDIGALAPGVEVDEFDIYLYSLDAAGKYRGFSFNGEYFLRWLQGIEGDGPLPLASMFDHGFYAEVGYMLIPSCFELNARVSQVYGQFGDAFEYASGVNWFINGTHNWKLSFDVTMLDSNPASNSGPDLRPGDDGMLFRTQLQAAF